MVGLLAVAAAGAAALMSHEPAAEAPADPLLGTLLQPQAEDTHPGDLYAKVRAEQHDPQAIRMEQQIKSRLMRLPLVGRGGNVLRVTCGSTMCEIAGTLPGRLAGFGPAKDGLPPTPPPPGKDYLAKLSFRNEDLATLGLKGNPFQFIRWEGQTKPFVFLFYYSRQDAPGK